MHDAVFRTRSPGPTFVRQPAARRLQKLFQLFKPLAEPGTAGTRQSETSRDLARDRVISTCGRGLVDISLALCRVQP